MGSMEMIKKDISKGEQVDGKQRERGKMHMPKQQTMWGVLMLLSLIVMLTAGISVVGSRKGWDGDAQGKEWNDIPVSAPAAGGGEGEQYLAVGQKREEAPALGTGKRENMENPGGQGELGTDGREEASPGGSESTGTKPENSGQDGPLPDEDGQGGTKPDQGDAKALPEDADAPVIAITFDDGPYTPVTNRIVDVLLEYDAGATFFVVGSRIDPYADTLKRVYESGFEVGSHTWSHKNLNKLSKEKVLKEINDTKERLALYIPVEDTVLVRPPYGSANETVRGLAGVPLINWSLDSEDWKSRDAKTIVDHVLSTVKDGDILLMHDLYESTAEAVEELVPELVSRGYKIVSVSELFSRKEIPLEEGILYRNPWDHY